MKHHSAFFNYLGTLSNGAALQSAYRAYKYSPNGEAFEINGRLKSGLTFGVNSALLSTFKNLMQIIAASNLQSITLYRMTSDTEFVGNLLEALQGGPIKYPAFLSTTADVNVLSKFVPSFGQPLVLEIECPPGTRMALMEDQQGHEEEYLLGYGTTFDIVALPRALSLEERKLYLGVKYDQPSFLLKLKISVNPAYCAASVPFQF